MYISILSKTNSFDGDIHNEVLYCGDSKEKALEELEKSFSFFSESGFTAYGRTMTDELFRKECALGIPVTLFRVSAVKNIVSLQLCELKRY